MTPKISIIVPVYNVELYLNDCINSILKQTYKNFEVLLINDGSTDSSSKICNELASIDNRIRVFHKENQGVSSARNLGLKEAKGEWICFVDSDDWIDHNTLENILPKENNDIDFVQFGFKQVNEQKKIIMQSKLPNVDLKIDKHTYLSTNLYHSAICGYLIKLNLIRKYNIIFPDKIKYGEDQAFILKAMTCCHNVYILNKCLYNYRYREGSAMNSSKTFSRAEDHLKVINNICTFMYSIKVKPSPLHILIFKELLLYYIRLGVDSTFNIYKVKKEYSTFCKSIKLPEVYSFCKKYDSYFIILLCYIKTRIIIPITLRIKKILNIKNNRV